MSKSYLWLLVSSALAAVAPAAQTTFSEAHPVFVNRCGQCHAVVGFGGFDIADPNIHSAYFDSQQPSYWAPGQTKGYAAYQRILNGSMPPTGGCTGDPILDLGQPGCLTAMEHAVLQAWIQDGQLGPSSSAGVNPNFDVRVVAQTGLALSFIHEVAIDDAATVVFRGQDAQGSGLFRVSAPGPLQRVTSPGSDLYDGLAVRAASPSFAVTRRRSGGAAYSVERWPIAGGPPTVLGASPTDFAIPQPHFDVAPDGRIAFWEHVGTQQRLLVGHGSPFQAAYTSPIGAASTSAPSIASDGRVAFRDNSGGILRVEPRTSLVTTVADATSGFALPLGPPQISDDGEWVFFSGNRGFGPGLIAWTSTTSPPTFLHLAGEQLEGVDSGAALTLRDMWSRSSTPDVSTLRAAFTGVVNGELGFYAASFRVRGAAVGAPYIGGGAPRQVLAQGATISGSIVAAPNTQARFNNLGALACTVALSGGPLAIVRAVPRGSADGPVRHVRLAFKRVLDANGKAHPAWSDSNVARMVRRLNDVLERNNKVGLRFEVDGAVVALPDPAATLGGPSWFDVVGAPASYEFAAAANPTATDWRTDAINVYLVDSLGGACGVSSYPPGHPCNAGTSEIVLLAPTSCGAANPTEGLTLSLVRQLGVYFGLSPTHETLCRGAESPAACAFPYDTGSAQVPGDGLRGTPFNPDATGTGDPFLLNAVWGACPHTLESVRQNALAGYATDAASAALTAGQIAAMLESARTTRAHVLVP
jgi:hypothetical protein